MFNNVEFIYMKEKDPQTIIDMTWDGVGDKQEALDILTGKRTDLFTLKDLENHLNGH